MLKVKYCIIYGSESPRNAIFVISNTKKICESPKGSIQESLDIA